MHDVVRRLAPGSVVAWDSAVGKRSFSYVAFLAQNHMFYTTATELNTYVPQVLTREEFANLIEAEGVPLYLAIDWQVQDVDPSSQFRAPVAWSKQWGQSQGQAIHDALLQLEEPKP